MKWSELKSDEEIQKAADALRRNNIDAIVVEDAAAAKDALISLSSGSNDIFDASSVTLTQIGFREWLKTSGKRVISDHIRSINDETERKRARREKVYADLAVGSAHALTLDGKIVVASASGSQIPAYAFSAEKVALVVGAQKIVKNVDEAFERIKEYVVPLEDKRMREARGMGTHWSKTLIFNGEAARGRITVVIVKKSLGF